MSGTMESRYPYGRSVGEDMEKAIADLKQLNEIMREALAKLQITPPLTDDDKDAK